MVLMLQHRGVFKSLFYYCVLCVCVCVLYCNDIGV